MSLAFGLGSCPSEGRLIVEVPPLLLIEFVEVGEHRASVSIYRRVGIGFEFLLDCKKDKVAWAS